VLRLVLRHQNTAFVVLSSHFNPLIVLVIVIVVVAAAADLLFLELKIAHKVHKNVEATPSKNGTISVCCDVVC